MTLEIIPVHIKKEIDSQDNLADLISSKIKLQDGDVLIVSQKIISKNEGRIVNLSSVIPSLLSVGIGSEYKKDPKLIEVILSESKRIVRMENSILIVETLGGFVCANAGVDESNVPDGYVTLLPKNPDESASKLKQLILDKKKKQVAVLISDTFCRAFLMGQTDVALGISGIDAILDHRGKKDSFGKTLRVTVIAIADELCSAAELVMGKTQNCPAVIIRNFKFNQTDGSIKKLIRPDNEDLFK